MKEVVIPKEKAVFWLDENGRWHNRHGLFEHRKVIAYFHRCIRKDADGFFLCQQLEDKREKVYFPFEDTALFVFDVSRESTGIVLILNTGKRVKLKPKKLFIQNDGLYMMLGEDRIKFVESGLMKMSDFLECKKDRFWIRFGNRKYRIPVRSVRGESSAG